MLCFSSILQAAVCFWCTTFCEKRVWSFGKLISIKYLKIVESDPKNSIFAFFVLHRRHVWTTWKYLEIHKRNSLSLSPAVYYCRHRIEWMNYIILRMRAIFNFFFIIKWFYGEIRITRKYIHTFNFMHTIFPLLWRWMISLLNNKKNATEWSGTIITSLCTLITCIF